MTTKPSRRGSGNEVVDEKLVDLLDELGTRNNRDQIYEILATVAQMATDDLDRLDLKITNSALREMGSAFRIFEPYGDVPKITMFGSARTLPDDPLYAQARNTAALLAEQGWMVVTGAGPGIMAAGLEGAGREQSMGINIRLPFEQGANAFIAGDPKLVEMKYFFTRKLMLLKESSGFVVLPGGFGTLDEALELLTLMQTGKADPSPIVLLDVRHGTYWKAWERFMDEEVLARGLVSPEDRALYRVTDDVRDAAEEILHFYRNYHSRRVVRDRLVLRLRFPPTPDELTALADEFTDICQGGTIEASPPLPAEVADDDHLDLPRIVLRFDRISLGRLRTLIDRLNRLPSVPDAVPPVL
ncbi:MAG: TIGR00730 family Rossman fold protein [Actinomycetota bacterium]|nr:TIGR00730 family Rossman fold protein [Actinomycetota bacterium]